MEGFNRNERYVEIPWCLNRTRGARVVLDVGYANAEREYLQGLTDLNIPDLVGVDVVPPREITVQMPGGQTRALLRPHQSDIRKTPFDNDHFDVVLCVSTIEHVGCDNRSYGVEGATESDGDFDAIREMRRILKPGGRLLLTVPFGRAEHHGWFRQYDFGRLCRLIAAADCRTVSADFFRYSNGWAECHPRELANTGYGTNGAVAAAGLACVDLTK